MAAVAQLLRVPVPTDYQLRTAGSDHSSLVLGGVRVPPARVPPRRQTHTF